MLRLARFAAIALGLVLLGETPALAFCRSSSCQEPGQKAHQGKVCDPPEPDDCGVELQWRQPCMGYTIQENGSYQVPFELIHSLVGEAFAAWTSVDCGNGQPSIKLQDLGDVVCNKVEYNQNGGNTNVIVFRDAEWTHDNKSGDGPIDTNTIALTTVTYDAEKGDIFDADMEINSAQNTFTTDDNVVDVDLLSVLTHEAGHFLGIAHTQVLDATMFPNYPPQSIDLRTLENDDMAAICVTYPPNRIADGECTYLPRHGYASECLDEQVRADCALSPGREPLGAFAWLSASALSIAILARLRARSARRSR